MTTVNTIRYLSGLNESYSDRVAEVVAYVVDAGQRDLIKSKEDIMNFIKAGARDHAPNEYRYIEVKTSKTWPDFVKDVLAGLKGKLPRIQSQSAIDNRAKKSKDNAELLSKVADWIESAAGQAFPDADPIDFIAPKLQKLGYRDYQIGDLLDKAARKHLGVKSYTDYLADLWDDHWKAMEYDAKTSGDSKYNGYDLDTISYNVKNNPWR